MEKQFDLIYQQNIQYNRPYISMGKIQIDPEELQGYQYIINIKNFGNIPARVIIEKVCYETEQNCTEFGEKELLVFPDSEGLNFKRLGDSDALKKEIGNNKKKFIYKLKYWSINDAKKEKIYFYEKHIGLSKDPLNPSNFLSDIVYVNGD